MTSGRALVIGSGIAGLLAARVLAKHFSEVVVLERDAEPAGAGPRKGVPQGHQAHVLLKAGERLLEAYFPGIVAELEQHGAGPLDASEDLAWFHFGVWKLRHPSGLVLHLQSRPLLEALVRKRLSGIQFRYRTAATGLLLDDTGRVYGVRAESDGGQHDLQADVVIDASGRGSHLPNWLEAAGFTPPAVEQVDIHLGYASRIYTAPAAADRNWTVLAIYNEPPLDTRTGVLFPVEDGKWLAGVVGACGDYAPPDEAGFLEFTASLPRPDMFNALRTAQPLSDIHIHRFPEARWRHYERLRRLPGGLVPFGDSVCSFDPVFGQGMTVAAQSARVLDQHLWQDPLLARPRQFLQRARPIMAVPWLMAKTEDLRFPAVAGSRPAWLRLLQRYNREVFLLSASNAEVCGRFLRVLHLLESPRILFAPAVAGPVLRRLAVQRSGTIPRIQSQLNGRNRPS